MLRILYLPAASLFLLLLPCFPGQDGGENEQSTDVISAWEGDSVSITCPMKRSGNEMGPYLQTSIRTVNVAYVVTQNASRILPALAGRVNCSHEGRSFRITLHNVQESDSNIYLCIKYSKISSYHRKINEKTTIVVVKGKDNGVVEQSPLYVNPQQGQSVNVTCALRSSHGYEELYLLKTHMQREVVLYVSSQNASTICSAFADRLEYSVEEKKIVITLHNLQKNDSGVYVCAVAMQNSSFLSANGSGTMMLVKDAEVEQSECIYSSWGIYALVIVVVLLFLELTCCALYNAKMKKNFRKRKPNNTIYEDMSYGSRRNTLIRANAYTNNN